jgi:hypothetical protein
MTRNHRYVVYCGIAAGAVTAAAMLGVPAALADDSGTNDLDLLHQAAADLTQADQLGVTGVPAIYPDTALHLVDKAEAAQATLLSPDDPFSGFANQVFAFPDGQLAHAGDVLLSAYQALAADPSGSNELDVALATVGFTGASYVVTPYDDIARLIDPLFGETGSSDAGTTGATSASAAAADAVTATDAAAATGATPADLLGEGQTDLTDANTVLSGIDLTGQPSDISSIVTNDMDIIGSQVQIQNELGMLQTDVVNAQSQLSGLPGYDLVTQATNALLTQADQSVLNADDAFLSGDQALATALSSGSGLANPDLLGSALAPLGVIGADFTAFGDTFDAAFTSILAPF